MRRDEFKPAFLLDRFSSVGPFEGVGHRGVVIGHERSEFRFEVGHRGKVSTPQTLAMYDPEDDLNLIEPRAVFRQVDKTDSMPDVRQKLLPRRHGFQDAAIFFYPARRAGRIVRPPISRGFPRHAY